MHPRSTTRVVTCLAAFLAVVCVAFAQSTVNSHYFVGDFTRINQSRASKFAIWSINDNRFIQASVGNIAGSPVRMVAHPSKAGAYVIYRNGGTSDVVAYYDFETDLWTAQGENTQNGDVYNDLFISGNMLYVCGDFTFSQRTTPVYRVARRSLDATSRDLWQMVEAPTADNGASFPSCSRIFKVSGSVVNMVMLTTGGSIQWQLQSDKTWVATPSLVSGCNLRDNTNNDAVPVIPQTVKFEGGFIYLQSNTGFTLGTDAASIYQIVRSQDGVSWSGVLRIPTTGNYNTAVYSYTVNGGDVYWASSQTIDPPNVARDSLFRATITAGEAAPARLGEFLNSVNTASSAERMSVVNGNVVLLNDGTLNKYSEGLDADSNWYLYFRAHKKLSTGVSQISLDGSSGWGWAMGGAFTSSTGTTVAPNQVVPSAAGGLVFAIGGFDLAWDSASFGMAAYNENAKAFVPFGNPLMDSTDDLTGLGYPLGTNNIKTVHAYVNSDGQSQTVIIGGTFGRINNATLNSIATIQSGAGSNGISTVWSALGAGLADGATINLRGNIIIENPGVVNAITSHPRRTGTGQVIYAGGVFTHSGSVGVRNVGRFELGGDGSQAWTGMKGGIAGTVYAIDTADRRYAYVAGQFSRAGNISANNIAMWDDETMTWDDMRGGVNGPVLSIYARGSKSVLVVGSFDMAGGVFVSNAAEWDGDKWKSIGCDSCNSPCDQQNGIKTCAINAAFFYEIKEIGGKIYFRGDNGEVYIYEGSLFKVYDPLLDNGDFDFGQQLLAKAPSAAKGQAWIAGRASSTLVKNFFDGIREYNVEDRNIYPVRGGFNGRVNTVSPASAVAPIVALVLAVIALLALLM